MLGYARYRNIINRHARTAASNRATSKTHLLPYFDSVSRFAENMGLAKIVIVPLAITLVLGLVESFEFSEADLASEQSLWDLYQRWRSHHTSSRDLEDQRKRFVAFKDNAKYVHEANHMDRPYKLKLNEFADMTNQEFISSYGGSKVANHSMFHHDESPWTDRFMHEKTRNVPLSIDWRALGAVTGVKNQGGCGNYHILRSLFH